MREATPYDLYILALMLWREARGQTQSAIVAVGAVARNRTLTRHLSYTEVVLQPYQFSSFNRNDPQYHKYPEFYDPIWAQCLSTAEGIIKNELADPTGGAVNYFDKTLDDSPPKWAREMDHTCSIGDFRFYKYRSPLVPTPSPNKVA